MIIWDYCFYQVIRVNTDNMNPPLIAYISGIICSALPLFLNIVTILIWFSIIPRELEYSTFTEYYVFIAVVILVTFILRYGPKKYKKLVEKWGDKAKSTKGKVLSVSYLLGSIIFGLITILGQLELK